MKVLVTGGSGFIGKRLLNALIASGQDVHALTRDPKKVILPGVTIVQGDLLSDLDIDLKGFDLIYHCAGEISDPQLMEKLHVDGTLNLLRRVHGVGTRWIQLSSVGVYGSPDVDLVDEKTSFAPVGEYEITKAKSEKIVVDFCQQKGIPFSILRPSIVIGSGMPNQSVNQLIRVIHKGLFAYFADPSKVIMNYVNVDDVVQALLLCGFSERAVGRDYILNDPITLIDLVAMVRKETIFFNMPKSVIMGLVTLLEVLRVRTPLTKSRVSALTNEVRYSSDRIMRELNFQYKNGVKKGLEEIIYYLL